MNNPNQVLAPKVEFLLYIAKLARACASTSETEANYAYNTLYTKDVINKVNEFAVGHEYNTCRTIALKNLCTLFDDDDAE